MFIVSQDAQSNCGPEKPSFMNKQSVAAMTIDIHRGSSFNTSNLALDREGGSRNSISTSHQTMAKSQLNKYVKNATRHKNDKIVKSVSTSKFQSNYDKMLSQLEVSQARFEYDQNQRQAASPVASDHEAGDSFSKMLFTPDHLKPEIVANGGGDPLNRTGSQIPNGFFEGK